MRDTIRCLRETLERGASAAYCRLVETRGSTPQKPGALMLVFPEGGQVGTLGGGCVEAEVKRRALLALADARAEIAAFQLDHDYGWDDGLICGGRMRILIEPLPNPPATAYLRQWSHLMEVGEGLTEAVVVDAAASGLAVPSSYLFDRQGRFIAALRADDPSAPAQWIGESLRPLHDRPRPYAVRGVAFLPTLPRCRLLIVGGGHVGKAVADLAADLDFDIWVVDDRAEFVAEERFPRASRRIAGQIDQMLPAVEITPDTYCIIVTRGHNHDEEALYFLAQRGARYVGLIGSRRKIRMIFDDLRNEGIPAEVLERVHAPLGIDIGSQSVPEIAVSICAELIAHRNRGGVVPGRPSPVGVTPGG